MRLPAFEESASTMSAAGSTNVGSLKRFCVAVRALAFALVAVLILPSLALADHHPSESSSVTVMQASTPDGQTDASPERCLVCHVVCSCHAGLPAAHSAVTFVARTSVNKPAVWTDTLPPSALAERLRRPPRA